MNTQSEDVLLVESDGVVAWLTMNRPDKCNALNVALNSALASACATLPASVKIVVLRGSGRHFCAGSDLADLYKADSLEAERVIRLEIEACHALAALPQLTVAMLHGKCLGGGAILPLYCDLRAGRAGMELRLPEIPLGWIPPYGIERILANIPRSFALEMMLSGRSCGDDEGLASGWIHRLHKNDEEDRAFIEALVKIPQQTLRDTCELMAPRNLQAIREADSRAMAAFLNHFNTDEARGSVDSFMERKRS